MAALDAAGAAQGPADQRHLLGELLLVADVQPVAAAADARQTAGGGHALRGGVGAGGVSASVRGPLPLAGPIGIYNVSMSNNAHLLYVGNVGNNSITVYRHDAAGNAAPVAVIAGPKTGIDSPGQLSEDAAGNLYVANDSPSRPAILVFAHGANGNVAPIRVLSGPHTGLTAVEAMTVDQTTGDIFVFNDGPPQDTGASQYLRFSANAAGDQSPAARTSLAYNPAIELASDSTGRNLIEAFSMQCCNSFNNGITTLPKQFGNMSSPAAPFSIDAFDTSGVADDPTTKTYLATLGTGGPAPAGIYRFAETTNGFFPYMGFPAKLSHPIVSVITSDMCGGQVAVATGPTPYTYVMNSTLNHCSSNSVYVYANNAAGFAQPVRILGGPATGMNQPYGIYEGK